MSVLPLTLPPARSAALSSPQMMKFTFLPAWNPVAPEDEKPPADATAAGAPAYGVMPKSAHNCANSWDFKKPSSTFSLFMPPAIRLSHAL